MNSHALDKSTSVTSGMLLAGKYRVERLLGEGGMGVVLAATNEALRQKVAIKLLHSGALANRNALGRFEREARAAASLRSEHVARVLDVGNLEDGRPYMVMEYLEGRDLGDVIDQGPHLPFKELVDYVLQACEAVAEAHAAGIIHRDLKPRNLFLTTTVDGRPLIKVLDFGISKTEDAADDMSLTRTTEIIGSPSYMSPEQLRASKEVDVRTDIWALGVILYELLTKKLPFQAATITELVAVVLMEPTPEVCIERPDVPEGLAYAINRCLAKGREARFSSIAELVGAIAPFGTGMVADIAERITRVSQGSSRALPPSDAGSGPFAKLSQSSGSGSLQPPQPPGSAPAPLPSGTGLARLHIHGGTSVAWGETQVEQPPRRRSKLALVAGALAVFTLLTGLSAGAVLYVKRLPPAAVATTPPAESVALPPGRKDLPPIAPAAAPGAATEPAAPVEVPSGLPSSRVLSSPPPASATASKGGGKAPPRAPSTGAPAPPSSPDLSDIGRR